MKGLSELRATKYIYRRCRNKFGMTLGMVCDKTFGWRRKEAGNEICTDPFKVASESIAASMSSVTLNLFQGLCSFDEMKLVEDDGDA